MQRGALHWSVLFLKLTPSLSLLTLNALSLSKRQHFLVLHTKLSPTQVHVVESLDDAGSLIRRCEVGKCQAPEHTIVKMIVEGIRQREIHVRHHFSQLLFLHSKWDVLDDNCCRDKFIVSIHAIVTVLDPAISLLIHGREGVRHS